MAPYGGSTTPKDYQMHEPSTVAQAIARHRENSERTLARLRIDNALDDQEKGQRITKVIAAANARLVQIVGTPASAQPEPRLVAHAPVDMAQRRLAARRARASQRDLRWG
jgi:hypothetical protein